MPLIPIDRIIANKFNERKEFDEEAIERLTISIKQNGFWGELVGREKGGMIELLYGARRLMAARQAKLAELPVKILPLSDEEMMALCVAENSLQEEVNWVDRAYHLKKTIDTMRKKNPDLTLVAFSHMVGVNKSTLSSMFSMVSLPTHIVSQIRRLKWNPKDMIQIYRYGGERILKFLLHEQKRPDGWTISDILRLRTAIRNDASIIDRIINGEIDKDGIRSMLSIRKDKNSDPLDEALNLIDGLKVVPTLLTLIESTWDSMPRPAQGIFLERYNLIKERIEVFDQSFQPEKKNKETSA